MVAEEDGDRHGPVRGGSALPAGFEPAEVKPVWTRVETSAPHTVCSVPSPHRGGNRKREEDFSGLLRTLGHVI